ncbi:nitrogen fixation/metabolism regulation signal transduction histidine kinase [Microbacterium halimionae]|uniref:Nitrogen fixation/metabolism regulation signal transduction histidine kinase n=1 Tax=Microbacterium halimionae TaxID=1526413 RepID=A0A7W3JLG5_9MICO|nr:hypothetical protein [Microbacterium halimionae]MBA8815032.1 nitrogen fixation/metabolism regulation signal transduction histidine kinase [Microbacterium halimionae]NII94177.1 nitrogen fixation/metabolism regulation signal transduction histidine kinase [Microbacterium halimionae]
MRISIEGDNAAHYSSRLSEQSSGMPDPGAVLEVLGNSTELAAARVTARLRNAALSMASHTNYIRSAVAQNAEALGQAVVRLQETDSLSETAAARGNAVIDSIVQADAASAAPSSSPAPTSSAAPASGSSEKRAF